MKIIRWLFSHLFLILLVVVVIYGYMFWGNLFGKETPAGKILVYLSSEFVEVDEFIHAIKAKQTQLSEDKASAEPQVNTQAQTETRIALLQTKQQTEAPSAVPSDSEVEPAPVTTRNISQLPVSISYSHNQMRVKQNSIGQIESTPEVANIESELETQSVAATKTTTKNDIQAATQTTSKAEPIALIAPITSQPEVSQKIEKSSSSSENRGKAAHHFVSKKIEQQLNNVDKNGKVLSPAVKMYAVRDSWITARKSFYQRKYALSEESYQQVISNTTDNFDAYGELGNVYFNQGKNTEAAAAYYEAASIFVRQGQINRAKSLMGLLKHLDNEKAIELQKLIDSAAS